MEKCDGLIVVGTALQTSFASSIINELERRDNVPMIEVNLEANIKDGYGVILL